jgi:hypothetical protein
MKRTLLSITLLLLITSSALVALSNETTMPDKEKINLSPITAKVPATSNDAKSGTVEKARISEHKITATELEDLKSSIGVYEPDQSYTQLVDGHGTGLRPPTEAEWAEIGASSYLIDSVDYHVGDGAPAAVDQSATPWFPPIGNQGSQGSCVAWSVGYYVKTFQEAQEHGWDLSGASWTGGYYGQPTVSYQDRIISPAFVYNLINGGVDNGLTYQDAIRLICFIGACSWKQMPYDLSTYTAWPSEAAWTEAALYRGNSSGIQYMSLNSEAGINNLKNWIASGHLGTISVDADQYSTLGSADIWTLDNYVSPDTNHANTIVGYDDSKNYTEGGTVHYGAFKVANSWGNSWSGDGFYWISYEAMKQRVGTCMFYYDMIDYQPELFAMFEISHEKRSECNIMVGMGNPNAPEATKSFSQYINGGTAPFPSNDIVMDITELTSDMPNVYGKPFWLRVRDSGSSTIGNITRFAVDHQDSTDAPCQTIQGQYIYLYVTLSFGQILVNARVPPSTPNQTATAEGNVSLFFGGTQWSSPQFHLLMSKDNLTEVSAGDAAYTPWFSSADLNTSTVTTYTSVSGAWQVGYNWINGTVLTSIAGGNYFFKASDDSSTEVAVSDTSITVTGVLQVTPTSGPAGNTITVSGYAFSANSSANITYLNPVTSTWVSITNNTLTGATGHFVYSTVAPDLMQNQPAGDNPEIFDAIIFRAQDNSDGAYYNTTTPFNEFRRGLAQVGNAVAAGLYGNNTDLAASVQVAAGHPLTVVGKWFALGNVVFLWDGANLDNAVVDESGFFSKTLTIPAASSGSHTIKISDANAEFLFTITVLQSPVTSDDYDGLWHTADFTITLTCADYGTGIGTTYYRINNGPVKNVAVDGQPLITTEGANNALEYWSVDGAGTEEVPHKVLTQIKLDKTAPTGSLKINNGARYANSSSVTLTLTATDTASGISQVRFSNDGVWDTEPWQSPVTTQSWVLTSGDGLKTVYCQIKDNAGLISTISSSITLDTTKPVAYAGQDQTVDLNSTVTFDASNCTDNIGITSYSWDFGDGTTATDKTTTHTYSNPGNYTATLTVRDAAGNTATSSLTVTVQANIAPEFPPAILLPLTIGLTLLTAVIYRRKYKR